MFGKRIAVGYTIKHLTIAAPAQESANVDRVTINDEIKAYLDSYLASETDVDFAVMISGAWGSGKTHFIKSYMDERKIMAAQNTPHHSSDYLYASLYGVRNTAEITDQFFAQVHPMLDSPAARLTGVGVSCMVNFFSGGGFGSEGDNRKILKDTLLKLKGRTLIFDDLERCAMTLADVMGFINAYVEHEKLKVIILASEDDVPQEQKCEYLRRKEKLIGKTLRINTDTASVLQFFIKKLLNKNIISIVESRSCEIKRIMEVSGKRNFRILRSALLDFERLVTSVDERLLSSPEALSKLLLSMLVIGLEVRSGELDFSEIVHLFDGPLIRAARSLSKKQPTELEARIYSIVSRYVDIDWSDSVIPKSEYGNILESGIIDVDVINRYIVSHPLVVGHAATPAWRELWAWRRLSREDYTAARARLISDLETRKLTNPGEILHVAGLIVALQDYGDAIIGEQDTVEYFEKYFEEVRLAGKLEPARALFSHLNLQGYDGLGYHSTESVQFRRIREIAQVATNGALADKMREVASDYLGQISSGDTPYSSLFERGTFKCGIECGKYGDAPFLHNIDSMKFARILIQDYALNDRLFASLQERYKCGNLQELSEEIPWLKKLIKSLAVIAEEAEPPHKKVLREQIEYGFNNIQDLLLSQEGEA